MPEQSAVCYGNVGPACRVLGSFSECTAPVQRLVALSIDPQRGDGDDIVIDFTY